MSISLSSCGTSLPVHFKRYIYSLGQGLLDLLIGQVEELFGMGYRWHTVLTINVIVLPRTLAS